MFQPLTFQATDQDWRLGFLAAAVCFVASVAVIGLFHRARLAAGRERLAWLGLDAAVSGYGIYATHFIAILAYDRTMDVGYNLTLTALSLFLGFLITGAGLSLALRVGPGSAALGGAVFGFAIALMHFTGMAALDLPGRVSWSPEIIVVAVVFGSAFGSLALFIAARGSKWPNTLSAAVLLTLAVMLTYLTAMRAMRFTPDPTHALHQSFLSVGSISALVARLAILFLGIGLVGILGYRHTADRLRQQKALLDAALDNISQGLCMYDARGDIIMCNERYAKMAGRPAHELIGHSVLKQLEWRRAAGNFDDDSQVHVARLFAELRQGNVIRTFEHADGLTWRAINHPVPGGGWVSTYEDITDWQEAQAQLAHMARHDALTNLPNRTLFRERLEQALGRATPTEQVAVLCLDLDHFKDVNDSLGHPVGDDLLKTVALRLSECLRKGDTVARLGGDEFAIVQVGNESPLEASSLATRLVESIGVPYDIQGHEIVIGASIGISVVPNDGCDPDQLLKNADMALYLAKENGRSGFRFFEVGMDARAQARRVLTLDLRHALFRSEFEVYYQPIYDLERNRIICFEALIRWNHPLRGIVEPATFIQLAEESGLIVSIGAWVLQRACVDAAGWSQDVSVAVNLSPAQFKNRSLVPSIIATVSDSGLAPNRLELEITESVLLQNSEATLTALHQLRKFGVRIAMDDFGTGYSSLSNLRSFPFDKIKIDQSFVRELVTNGDSMAIIRAVAGLGKSLGIATIAEGVETNEQLALLRAEGCTEVQGFLFSRPQPAAEVERMLHHEWLRDSA